MPPCEFASVRALKEKQLVENVEMGIVRGPGEITWISVNAAPISLPGYGVVVAYSDITTRKTMEERLRKFNDELEQRVAERTAQLQAALSELRQSAEAKDAFLASVSHELRTPLAGVLGITDILELQTVGELNERQLRYVQQLHLSGERLLKMVNGILDYTALLAGRVPIRPDVCRLVELGAISLRAVHPQAEAKKQKLKLSIEPHSVEIISDADGINQVLSNLLDNAVKFTPEGGTIGLDIAEIPDQGIVRLTVWDTGIGIAPAQHEAIFKPFEQVDHGLARKYEGVGLGLPYTRQMVQLLGGSLTLESALGQGSSFTVTLPIQMLAHHR
jgi:signal transduction histidine kinase